MTISEGGVTRVSIFGVDGADTTARNEKSDDDAGGESDGSKKPHSGLVAVNKAVFKEGEQLAACEGADGGRFGRLRLGENRGDSLLLLGTYGNAKVGKGGWLQPEKG